MPESVTDQQILDTVSATGYSARLKAAATTSDLDDHVSEARISAAEPAAAAALRPRLLLAAALTLPVLIISMVPAAQFPHWGWWAFALSLPVVTWAAWPFHRRRRRERPPSGLHHGHARLYRRGRSFPVFQLAAGWPILP